jgi:hypothetical protein
VRVCSLGLPAAALIAGCASGALDRGQEPLYIVGVSLPVLGHVLPVFNLLEHLASLGHQSALLTSDVRSFVVAY